jgi:glycerol-3-phosphate cytidylyltransferase-like family protein
MKEKIIELRKQGKSYNEISKELNCSKGTINYHCKNLDFNDEISVKNKDNKNINQIKNLPEINFGDKIDDKIIKECIYYRNKGFIYNEILEKVNISEDKLKKICKCKGLDDQNQFRKPSVEEIEEMQQYYDECKSVRKVSEKFKWSTFTICKYLKVKHARKIESDIEEMQMCYDEIGSIRKVAKIFGWSTRTISKYIKIKNRLTTEEIKKHKSNNVVSWRKRTKIKLVEYKGGKCEICGYDKCTSALSFHHKDPAEKDFSISSKSYSFERLKEEVDKCMLVCQNCHIEIHESK